MNDYYERQQARRERLEARLEKAQAQSHAHYNAAMSELRVLPLGQPILVGHHSERRHRALIARSDRHMEKSHELIQKAAYLEEKLEGVGKGGISSDAPDAIDLLRKKLAKLEEMQTMMKQENAKAGRGNEKPYPSYALSNNNANIRRVKARISELEKRALQSSREWEFEGGRLVDSVEENRVQVFFDEKPEEEIRAQLKGRGFHWSPRSGAWQRMRGGWALVDAKRIVGLEL